MKVKQKYIQVLIAKSNSSGNFWVFDKGKENSILIEFFKNKDKMKKKLDRRYGKNGYALIYRQEIVKGEELK